MSFLKRNERGAADVVALMFGIIILLSLSISALDAAMYFTMRSQVQAGARDGARSVAIYGGAGEKMNSGGRISYLRKAYGDLNSCAGVPTNATGGKRLVECDVYKQLSKQFDQMGYTDTIVKVTCGPDITKNIGDHTFCDVVWTRDSIPGSPITIFSTSRKDMGTINSPSGALDLASSDSGRVSVFSGAKTVTGTSQSEVKLSTDDLTSRR